MGNASEEERCSIHNYSYTKGGVCPFCFEVNCSICGFPQSYIGGHLKCDMKLLGFPDKYDVVNHPKHYTSHPSGIECIDITRHMGFNLGNAFKYIWRADLKANAIEDLKKAAWYLADEIKRREASNGKEINREAPETTSGKPRWPAS